ncbi:MAG: hypothetical protein ACD_4C00064G0001, partial [uncultured bacterium (gcode 4)]
MLLEYSKSIWIEVIVEVQNKEEVEKSIKNGAKIIWINTRSLNNLSEVDFEKISEIKKIIPKDIAIIGESWIEMASHMNKHQLDWWIVGSTILASRSIKWSLRYFKEQNDDIPYIWLRPWARLDNRIEEILNELIEMWFELLHSVQ